MFHGQAAARLDGWMAELLPLINKLPGTPQRTGAAAEKRSITRRGRDIQSSLCFVALVDDQSAFRALWIHIWVALRAKIMYRRGKPA